MSAARLPDSLRILHTNMHKAWGGQPNRILTTMVGLRERGHEVTIAGPRGAELHRRARDLGFDVFEDLELRRGFHPLSLWGDVRSLRRHLRQVRHDLVDTHGSQDTWVFALACLGLEYKPAFVRTRHNIFPVRRHPANVWLYRRIDHAITISPQVIPHMSGLLAPEQFTPIYSAPDPARFDVTESREAVRRELGYEDVDKVIGVVARLAPEKGHTVLLEAAPSILERHPRARLLFVGTGRSRPALEEQVRRLGLDDKVHFAGFRQDVPRLLQAMDLFVLPCTSGESLGTSILEAFLMQRPVVACDVGGVCESVRDGATGRLVPPGDARALAEAIVDQLDHPERAQQWALAGKRLVEAQFTPARIAEQTEDVYRRVMQERKAVASGELRVAKGERRGAS